MILKMAMDLPALGKEADNFTNNIFHLINTRLNS